MGVDHLAGPGGRVLRGEFSLEVGAEEKRCGLLPRLEQAGLGRGATCAIRVRKSWVPRNLGSFLAVNEGWVLRNGPSLRVSATSQWVTAGQFQPSAMVMLQQGSWQLAWPLDERFELHLDIKRVPQEQVETLKGCPPPSRA